MSSKLHFTLLAVIFLTFSQVHATPIKDLPTYLRCTNGTSTVLLDTSKKDAPDMTVTADIFRVYVGAVERHDEVDKVYFTVMSQDPYFIYALSFNKNDFSKLTLQYSYGDDAQTKVYDCANVSQL